MNDTVRDGSRAKDDAGRNEGSALDSHESAQAPASLGESGGTFLQRAWYVFRGLAPFARAHRKTFLKGAVAALVVVVARLALPWPLRLLLDPWVQSTSVPGDAVARLAAPTLSPVVMMAAAFLVIITVLGLADFLERLYFARFSIAFMHDLRSEAFASIVQLDKRSRKKNSGDIVARLIGDTARIRTGLRGFLVHVATNSLVFLGVVGVLFYLDFTLGLIFAGMGIVTGLTATWGASRLFDLAFKHREKEGKLANRIYKAMRKTSEDAQFARVSRSSGAHEASMTRIQGTVTWTSHILYGVAVFLALWIGAGNVNAGHLAPGDMVIFMMYALMMRGPVVRLTRQGVRTGRILGTGYRLVQALSMQGSVKDPRAGYLMPLRESIQLENVFLSAGRSVSLTLTLQAGERIVLCGTGPHDSCRLLQIIAGVRDPARGRLLWDGKDLSTVRPTAIATQVAYIPSAEEGATSNSPGVEEAPLGAFGNQEALLRIAPLIHTRASVWVLDRPTAGLSEEAANSLLAALLRGEGASAVVVSTDRPADVAHFDRVLHLHEGQVIFDGPPRDWLQAREQKQRTSPDHRK